MGETSEQWGQWNSIYWSHFQCKQFAQFLLGDFHQQLEIPTKFSQHMKEKLPESIILRGPSGITWNVEIISKDDALFFEGGWQEFVKDHSLKENDLLVFRYHEKSHFDVLIFDAQNLCEKEASYFITKCVSEKPEEKSPRKREEYYVEANHIPTHYATDCTSFDNSFTGEGEMTPVKSKGRTRTEARAMKAGSVTRLQWKGLSNPEIEIKPEPDSEKKQKTTYLQYVSNRRPITDDEKKKAQQLAQRASTGDSFMVVMRPSHVYRKFQMGIPGKWVTEHLSSQNQHIVLRIKDKTWRGRFSHDKIRGGGKLSNIRQFAADNSLEEFDVCVFYPSNVTNSSDVVLDVSIFRVVQDLTARTEVLVPP